MLINGINTRKYYHIKDIHIVSDSEGIEAIFLGDNKMKFGVIRANYPNWFHPSDEFKEKICKDLRYKYLKYWESDNIYTLSSDLQEFILSEIDGIEEDKENDEYCFEETD